LNFVLNLNFILNLILWKVTFRKKVAIKCQKGLNKWRYFCIHNERSLNNFDVEGDEKVYHALCPSFMARAK
jgi:hypothetical protein